MSWNEVAEIIEGEIEKNGRCTAETAWTLAGHLIKKLEIPGLKKKTDSKIDVNSALKVVPELSRFESNRGRYGGITMRTLSNTVETSTEVVAKNETLQQTGNNQQVVSETKNVVVVNDNTKESLPEKKLPSKNEDVGPSRMPGSLLGNADDPGRPNLLPPDFGSWAKPKEKQNEEIDVLFLNDEKYEIHESRNPSVGKDKLKKIVVNTIVHVFGGTECEGGQVKFQNKEFLLPEENLKMFRDTLWYVFNASQVLG